MELPAASHRIPAAFVRDSMRDAFGHYGQGGRELTDKGGGEDGAAGGKLVFDYLSPLVSSRAACIMKGLIDYL
jgi:hypothetical protein